MKKFTKLFLSCALVSVVAAATAAMASAAADGTWSGDLNHATYDDTTGLIEIAKTDLTGITDGQQATILVYEKGAQTIDSTTIVAIDQAQDAVFTSSGIKGKPTSASIAAANTADSTKPTYVEYTVKVGYYAGSTFTVKEGTLLIGEKPGEPITIGEVDGDNEITTNDASCVLAYGYPAYHENCGKVITVSDWGKAKHTGVTGSTLLVGDVDDDNEITTNDASCILANGYAAYDENCGEVIQGTVAAAAAQ